MGNNGKGYDRLTPQRKKIIDEVVKNLENGGIWKKGWVSSGAPRSGITGKKYRGINSFYLTIVAAGRGYKDDRWVTFNQMRDKNWRFKTDGKGKSGGKGAGVPIEYFDIIDKATGKPMERGRLSDMTAAEKNEYMAKNTYPLRRSFTVFNGDIIDGMPERAKNEFLSGTAGERTERLLKIWDKNEARIIYGGEGAYYEPDNDEIHLPFKSDFKDITEFYGTAMHEIAHSTGHKARLNRNIDCGFGTAEYALEELCAEIASVFLVQETGITPSERNLENNAAYIASWKEVIEDDPDALFSAVSAADRAASYVVEKEREYTNRTEYYAIEKSENGFGDSVYHIYMTAPDGGIRRAVECGFAVRGDLMREFEKLKEVPLYKNAEFKETDMNDLKRIGTENLIKRRKEEAEPFMKNGTGYGERLTITDREALFRAASSRYGGKFLRLYNGERISKDKRKDEISLMRRIAVFCDGDGEQLLRIYKSSGMYDGGREKEYDGMAKDALRFVYAAKKARGKTYPAKKAEENFETK